MLQLEYSGGSWFEPRTLQGAGTPHHTKHGKAMPGPAPPPPVVGQPASMLMRVAEFVGLEDIDQLRPAAGPVQLPEGGGALAQEEPDPTEQVQPRAAQS